MSVAGSEAEAVAAVEAGAAKGDAEASFMLANWRLFGVNGPRDPAAAKRLLDQASARSIEAARLLACLTGNGAFGTADPVKALEMLRKLAPRDPASARQVALVEAMPPPDAVRRLPATVASQNPPIWVIQGFCSASECQYLIEAAAPAIRPSFIVDPQTGRQMANPIRTSSDMNFDPGIEDLVVHAINRRLAAATGTDVACGELLQILRYEGGQQYRPHLDVLPDAANQRDWTALVYLNDGYEGGETLFDLLGVKVKGGAGDALLFRNVTPEGSGDPRTRHAGLPVTKGEKWLASRWIRRFPYSPFEG